MTVIVTSKVSMTLNEIKNFKDEVQVWHRRSTQRLAKAGTLLRHEEWGHLPLAMPASAASLSPEQTGSPWALWKQGPHKAGDWPWPGTWDHSMSPSSAGSLRSISLIGKLLLWKLFDPLDSPASPGSPCFIDLRMNHGPICRSLRKLSGSQLFWARSKGQDTSSRLLYPLYREQVRDSGDSPGLGQGAWLHLGQS